MTIFHAWRMPMTISDTLKGRLIAYFGGGGVAGYSADVSAIGKTSEMITQAPDSLLKIHITPWLTVGDVLTVVGSLVVIGRLAFDVYCYVDKRRRGAV